MKENLCSADDLQDIAKYLLKTKNNNNNLDFLEISELGIAPTNIHEKATLRELDEFIKILGGV